MQLWRRYWNLSHYLLQYPDYLQEGMTLFNAVTCIVSNISDFNDDQLTEIFLYGKEDFKNVNDTSILDVTINYLIETKIFDAQLFWCSPDIMASTFTLHLKFIFLFFFFFCFYYFCLFIIFRLFCYILYVRFSVSTCITTHVGPVEMKNILKGREFTKKSQPIWSAEKIIQLKSFQMPRKYLLFCA